jgi:hypothetical protein
MKDHGWIEYENRGISVCPADWVITLKNSSVYTCKPGRFEKDYELLT